MAQNTVTTPRRRPTKGPRDFMRGGGLADGLREDALEQRRLDEAATKAAKAHESRRQHAEKALDLLVAAQLSDGTLQVALKVVDCFISIQHEGPGRTAVAIQAVKDQILGSEARKGYTKAQRYVENENLRNGVGAARQMLQEAFNQLSSKGTGTS